MSYTSALWPLRGGGDMIKAEKESFFPLDIFSLPLFIIKTLQKYPVLEIKQATRLVPRGKIEQTSYSYSYFALVHTASAQNVQD